jgi:redox-sensitive bicupin YhaK (pirin superfamily)
LKAIVEIFRNPPQHWVGDGFPVRTVFSYDCLGHELSPFLLLDYAGPHRFEPATRPRGVSSHPHRGFETVTIVYDGEVAHRDSTGDGGVIGPGDVQWMTAGSGILHQEFHSAAFTKSGGLFRMVQLWVNLPSAYKLATPRYQAIKTGMIPVVSLGGGAVRARIIAGSLDGQLGPAKSFTALNVWDLDFDAGESTVIEAPEGHTALIVVLWGVLTLEWDAEVREAEAALFTRRGAGISLAASAPTKALVLTGTPIGEPIVGRGPFVMNREVEIQQAFRDFSSGRFGMIARG